MSPWRSCARTSRRRLRGPRAGVHGLEERRAAVAVTFDVRRLGLDLCAISFTSGPGKQAVAFFDAQAKASSFADEKASG